MLAFGASIVLGQATLYWDLNGPTLGASTVPTGEWNTKKAANWNTAADGTGGTVNWTSGSNAVLSAGTDATGAYTVSLKANMTAGDLTFQEGSATIIAKTLTLNGAGGSTLDVAASATAQIDSTLAGSVGLIKAGAGTLTVTGTNSYSGPTTLAGGTLSIDGDRGLGAAPGSPTAGKVIFDGGTLETTATLTLSANRGITINSGGGFVAVNAGTILTYGGILAGTGTLTKAAPGTLILAGTTTNSHTGDINVGAGTLQINKAGGDNRAIGDNAAVTVASGANLTFAGGRSESIGSLVGGGAVDNSSGTAITLTTGGNNASTNFSGVIQNTGGNLSLTKVGTGTLTLSGTSANTFTGALTVNDGTLSLGKTGGVNAAGGNTVIIGDSVGAASSANLTLLGYQQMPDTAAVTINADGRLALNNFAGKVDTIGGLGLIDLSTSGFLTVGTHNGTSSFGGTIAGTGTLIKEGTGTLTFNRAIDFGGTLTLAGGTLGLNATTLNVGTFHITGNTILDFGNSSASILSAANVIINPGVTLTIVNWVDLQNFFYATNSFTQNGGPPAGFDVRGVAPQNQIAFTGFSSNSTAWQSWDMQITPTPEPATYGAIFVGLAAAMVVWRRRLAGHA